MHRTMSDEDVEAIARRVAELLRETSPQQPEKTVLTLKEAIAYTGKSSAPAFYRWAARHRVRSCSYGRYSRAHLDLGLSREAGVCRAPPAAR